ncbi:MAG: hypothetical protein AB7I36_07215 [Rhodospirillaceae bacterium]
MTTKEQNTGSGTQTVPPRPQQKVAGDVVTHRAPKNDADKNSRDNGAEDTRPGKIEREESGMMNEGH